MRIHNIIIIYYSEFTSSHTCTLHIMGYQHIICIEKYLFLEFDINNINILASVDHRVNILYGVDPRFIDNN